jgi:hypothetical protein
VTRLGCVLLALVPTGGHRAEVIVPSQEITRTHPRTLLFNFYLFAVLGFELRAFTVSRSTALSVKGFLGWGLTNHLPGLALNRDPPDLCFLSSWDYRCEHQCPACFCLITIYVPKPGQELSPRSFNTNSIKRRGDGAFGKSVH